MLLVAVGYELESSGCDDPLAAEATGCNEMDVYVYNVQDILRSK
jgi:hypothetical protein